MLVMTVRYRETLHRNCSFHIRLCLMSGTYFKPCFLSPYLFHDSQDACFLEFMFSRVWVQVYSYFRMGFFGAANKSPTSLKYVIHILQWWNLAQLCYLRKIQIIYELCDTPLEFCWHKYFFTWNQQILLYQIQK